MAHLGGMLPWLENPPDEFHVTASRLITDIWLEDAYTGDSIAKLPWIYDGVGREDVDALWLINHFFFIDPELGRGFIDSPWVVDGLKNDEFERVDETLRFISLSDPDLALLLVTTPWAADGLDDEEWFAFESLLIMGLEHRELTRLLATSSWVADGAGLESPNMSGVLNCFLTIASKYPERARLVATAQWVIDGVSSGEARVLQVVANDVDSEPEVARALLDLPPAVQVLSADDQLLYDLVPIARWDVPTALTVARYATSSTKDMRNYLTKSLTHLINQHPDLSDQLTEQSWFTDGLNGSEAALVSTLFETARKSPPLVSSLLESHFTEHKTTSLPLAGNVDIWVVHNAPPPSGEDLLKTIEDTVRISENFMGTPFPTTDIILFVVTPIEGQYGIGGAHYGSHMVLERSLGSVNNIPHETAHYYFYFNFGQVWVREGAAEFMEALINAQTGGQSLADRSAQLAIEAAGKCIASGTENIRHFSYELEHIYEGRFYPGGCGYILGENFLHNIHFILGAESMSVALRELYSRYEVYLLLDPVQPPSEEDIYDAFLMHTPPDRLEAFQDLYRRLHGGHFAFPTTDFSDEHGDEPATAHTIAQGQAVRGDLDYMFDFDYFRFQAEKGVKYRMNVNHGLLRESNVTLLGTDGLTQEIWNWKSRKSTSTGPQILWVAPSSGHFYFAVQNFGGKTGSYTLVINAVDDLVDDHGDTLTDATDVPLGEVVQGSLENDFDFDYFRFQAEEGRAYRIDVMGASLEGFRVKLYTSDGAAPKDWYGNQFAEDSASGEITQWLAPSSGHFYVAIEGYNEHVGTYSLTISRANS